MGISRISRTAETKTKASQPGDHLAAWKEVLSHMEDQLDDGEAFLVSLQAATANHDESGDGDLADHISPPPSFDFSPPQNLGPLPAELAELARTILDRQRRLEAATQTAMNTARKHSDAAKAMRPSAPSVPVYFDGSL